MTKLSPVYERLLRTPGALLPMAQNAPSVSPGAPPVNQIPPREPGLTPPEREQLLLAAQATPERAWPPGTHISLARNAHITNTFAELQAGLAQDFNFLEGDVRLHHGVPVMAHDLGQTSGMNVRDWLEVGALSQRGLKLDIKEASAIEPTLAATKAAGIPDERLIVNVTVMGPDPSSVATLDQLRWIRQQFPRALVNLSFSVTPYTPEVLMRASMYAGIVGAPVMFPLRAEFVTPQVVAALKPHGMIAIWNSPLTYRPTDIPADTARFRGWGVDGMIDLRSA